MAKDDSTPPRHPEDKPSSGNPPRVHGPAGRLAKRGRSGYGMESIRPHLRAQLEQQKLLRPTFPPEDPEETNRSNGADR